MENKDPMKEAERVDQLADHVPQTESSRRDAAGNIHGVNDGNKSDMGLSDTPNGLPEMADATGYDPSRRGQNKIQGEEIETTGDHSERQPQQSHT